MEKLQIDAKTAALLVMDCQVDIMGSLAPSEKAKVLSNLRRVIGAARKVGIAVIYVVVQFRDGYPEISARNVLFSGIKEAGRLRQTNPNTRICDEISPEPDEVIITKKRISAFTGSDLEVVLNAMGVDTIVLTGVSSLGVVESTARFAFDMDYRIIVIGDCCSDRDTEVNQVAVAHLLPRISTVCSADDFVAAISQ